MILHPETDMDTLVSIVNNTHETVDRKSSASGLIMRNLDDMNGGAWSLLSAGTRKLLIKFCAGDMANVPLEASHA